MRCLGFTVSSGSIFWCVILGINDVEQTQGSWSPCCEPHVFFGGWQHPSITHRNEYALFFVLAFWRTSLRAIISPGRTTSMPTRSWCDSWPMFYWRPSNLKGKCGDSIKRWWLFSSIKKKAVNFRSSIFWDTKNAVERFGRRFCLWILVANCQFCPGDLVEQKGRWMNNDPVSVS